MPRCSRRVRSSRDARRWRTEMPLRLAMAHDGAMPPRHERRFTQSEPCRTARTGETVWLMERTWKLPGGYANWTLTLTTAPVEGATEPFLDDWSPDALDRLGEYFSDTVSLIECRRVIEGRA